MSNLYFFQIFVILLQFLYVNSQAINSPEQTTDQDKVQQPADYRFVRKLEFKNDKKYDVIQYKWNITGSKKTGIFGYYVYSSMGVCTLLMNSTEFNTWESTRYQQWLDSTDYQFNFLSDNLESFMCKSPVATCNKSPVRFPDNELYMVILPRPEDENTSYYLYDQVNSNNANAAELVYDPIDGYINNPISTTNPSPMTETKIQSFKTTKEPKPTETVTSDLKEEKDDNTLLYVIFGIIGLIIVLAVIALLIIFYRRKNNNKGTKLEDTNSSSESVNKKVVAGYVPHHTMKRVAYRYTCSSITLEKNDFIELIERYNDGWVKVINPTDAEEYIIPLMILEGDSDDDLNNVPLGENNEKRLLSTPENLFENKFISQEDYDEMKRNDDWIKKVKLMKRPKPESLTDGSIVNLKFKDETSSIKNNPHYFQRPPIETQITIENENSPIMDPEMMEKRKAIKSMVATLELECSNAELLPSDNILSDNLSELNDKEEEEEVEVKVIKDNEEKK